MIIVAFDGPSGEKAKGGVIPPFGRLRSYHGLAQDGKGGGPIGSVGSRDVAVHGVRHLNRAGVLDGRCEAQLQDACSKMAGGVLGPLELAGKDALGQCALMRSSMLSIWGAQRS